MFSKQAIAQHLNIDEVKIKSIEEWANCLFVCISGLGARFVSKKVGKIAKMEPKITKIYDNVCFPGELSLDSRFAELATGRQLIGRGANGFLRLHFKPGDLVETKDGVHMLDRLYNPMKAGFHLEDPEQAKYLVEQLGRSSNK